MNDQKRVVDKDSDWIIIDSSYMRNQARDAVRTLVAPLQGVYTAVKGGVPRSAVHNKPPKNQQG